MRKTAEILESIINMIQQLEQFKNDIESRDVQIGYLQSRAKDLENIITESGIQPKDTRKEWSMK